MKAVRITLLTVALMAAGLAVTACDCSWSATAVAWLDEDRDGELDPGEKPLPNIVMRARYGSEKPTIQGVTGLDGAARLYVFPTGCEMTLEVYPEVPEGYTLTTPAGRPVTGGKGEKAAFGFTYAPGVTPTPRPESDLQCDLYALRLPQDNPAAADISHIAPQPGGGAWVTANYLSGGYYALLSPAQPPGDLLLSPLPDLGDFDDANSVTVTEAGETWFATGGGLAQLRGSDWITHTVQLAGFRPGQLADAEEQTGGSLWVAAYGGLARFDPRRETWQPVLHTRSWDAAWLRRAPDGSLWAAAEAGEDDLVLIRADASGSPISSTVAAPGGQELGAAAVGPDGAWWFGLLRGGAEAEASLGEHALARLEPGDGGWTVYTRSSTGAGLTGDGILALAVMPDGVVLVGTAHGGLLRARPDEGEWRSYTTEDGLPADSITGLVVGSDGVFWLSACDATGGKCPGRVEDYGAHSANLLARCRFGSGE